MQNLGPYTQRGGVNCRDSRSEKCAERLVLGQVWKDAAHVGNAQPPALTAILDYIDRLAIVGIVSPFDVAIDKGPYHFVGITNALNDRLGERDAEDHSTERQSLRAGQPPGRIGYATASQETDQEVSQLKARTNRPD